MINFYTLLIKAEKFYIAKNLCESTRTRRKQVQKLAIDNESVGYLLEFIQNTNDVISFDGYLVSSNLELKLAKQIKYYFSIAQFEQFKANFKKIGKS